MREAGLRCGIRRETDHRCRNACRGPVGDAFENLVARNFSADGPWQKLGTDAAEFKRSIGKGNCLDNAATEQVFGHLKDEFFRGGQWPDLASFKRDLEAHIVHWNTRRRQKRLKGLTPEEFRNQSLVQPYYYKGTPKSCFVGPIRRSFLAVL